MYPRFLLSILCTLIFTLPTFAQVPWQFRWQKGQTLTYKIKLTSRRSSRRLKKAANTSKFAKAQDLVNRWQVADVDNKGVATLSMTIVAMRNEQKRANGETLLFDSQNLDKSTPELRETMSKFIGQTAAVVRVDGYGRLIDVKQGSAASYEAEPPFLVVFPEAKAAVGQAWRRPFEVTLDPPYGTGEKLKAEQRYSCKKIEAGQATLGVQTEFKMLPEIPRERIPLLQRDTEGEIVFDLQTGRLIAAQLFTSTRRSKIIRARGAVVSVQERLPGASWFPDPSPV